MKLMLALGSFSRQYVNGLKNWLTHAQNGPRNNDISKIRRLANQETARELSRWCMSCAHDNIRSSESSAYSVPKPMFSYKRGILQKYG